ncbi:RNA polymerase sigma factor FliA [Jeongeupia sp. HS-3]|uniref:RNA polymerase sigma factor FliA n=1 Tax=Jeongeupia sp. HS-3 TaxID=1009682 RepID=UPI0018A35DE2|nr:RNA polymerase sigma factor FliA [Jeongeupia sp. HS-3]BCL74450.1 RNA polymerase sigma factor FliA [Jeongeupia sp. HS-3]
MLKQRALKLYRDTRSDSDTELLARSTPLVKKIAYHLIARLPASIDVEDLIQVGLIGLMEAARNFDASAGAQFETFASQRIRGAMLDELRSGDWLPRQTRRNLREIDAAIHKLEQTLGRAPGEMEIAQAMDIPLTDYQDKLGDARGHQLLHIDDYARDDEEHGSSSSLLDAFAADHAANPLTQLDDAHFRARLIEGIEQLPEREKLLMALYYDEELNLKEIGAVLGVSESRVCQLHSQAVARLRTKLTDWTAR